MRRTAALLALAALSWSQLAALRCDMGASTPMLEAGPRTIASAHHGSAPQPAPAPPGHHHLSTEEAPATPHGEHHGESGGCLMILAACGAASARTAQTTILARFPGVSVRANLYIAPIPAAVSMGIETPPPRSLA